MANTKADAWYVGNEITLDLSVIEEAIKLWLDKSTRQKGHRPAYDIIFRAPRFAKDGTLQETAYMTVLLNGVLVQNHQELMGPTVWKARAKIYEARRQSPDPPPIP